TGVTFVPLNVICKLDRLAKPAPDIATVLAEPPDVGFSVIAADVNVTWFVSSVTAPLSATSLPSTDAPVVAVIDDEAIIVPSKTELVPSVAELPTCQNTFDAVAPLAKTTLLAPGPAAVVSVLDTSKI